MDALITVVIPVYNVDRPKFRRCLASVLAQSHASLMVVVVDDGSDPDTAAWLDGAVVGDARVRLVHQRNQGVSAARNCGVLLAEGEYVCFVDADDYVRPEFLMSALSIARRTGADMVLGGIRIVHDDSTFMWRSGGIPGDEAVVLGGNELADTRAFALSSSPSVYADSPLTSAVNAVAILFSLEIAKQISFPVGVAHAEDRLYNFAALGMVGSAAFCSDEWYVYDQTGSDSATRNLSLRTGLRLAHTIRAYAVAGGFADAGDSPPAVDPRLRDAAAEGAFKYLKVMALILVVKATPRHAVQAVADLLAVDGVHPALADAPAQTASDRLVRWSARRRDARLIVTLARLRALAARRAGR